MGCICDKADVEIADREFKVIRQFGKGGFSQLFLVEELSTKRRWAMKRLDCHSQTDVQRVCREIEMHRQFGSHPNILPLEAFTKRKTAYGYQFDLIFEYYKVGFIRICLNHKFSLQKGSLQDELLRRRVNMDYLSESRVIQIFSQVVNAVSVLHSHSPSIAHRFFLNIALPFQLFHNQYCDMHFFFMKHNFSFVDNGSAYQLQHHLPDFFLYSKFRRDLKPGNILFSNDDQPILMDFGSCCECPIYIKDYKDSRFQLDEASELCSMPYRAPELFTCEISSVIDCAIDIWSLGCLLYALCFFRSLFDDIYERGDSIALAVQSPNIVIPNGHPLVVFCLL
ncbi:unnamed protein product [Enterobius vermicularis]|uniref:non-specific serine/threonine protein kinase n=1 Tax=Enterobius vermicularis TaxID=51028 RepID=A0A0N4UXN6_ENTVE|nr:unnamed protein product [Enterobius vermicularis]